MAIEILQTQRLPARCEQALAERYVVHRLFDAADRQALLADVAPRVRATAGGHVDAALMDRLPRLEIIAVFGVGYDSVDTEAARSRRLRVTNTPEVLNDAVAELAIGLMVALARHIPQADRYVRGGGWAKAGFPLQAELNGKTLGILGLGRIGKEIATRAQAMKMRVVYHGRHRQPYEPYVYYSSLLDMARDCDWLVAVAPGGRETYRMVSREVLAALGPAGGFVNLGRGTLVDEAALVELLQSGELGGAALDVFEHEPHVPEALFGLDNVVLSPHQGSGTRQTRERMGALVVANLDAHFAGEPLPSAVV
ncbi:2-hydroxyacid dehydrogenase [Devosia sp.]|uniref:2-hydroxyacid dehydrogenase n=1 Tax=Devosia sp. TaxID=1871048 RepID=UPI002F083E5C